MTIDPRAALDRLVAALEAHLTAASNRRGETDPAVATAYQTLADAFEKYDNALYEAFDEVTPFVLYDDTDEEGDSRTPEDFDTVLIDEDDLYDDLDEDDEDDDSFTELDEDDDDLDEEDLTAGASSRRSGDAS
jgi:hypothetical protein